MTELDKSFPLAQAGDLGYSVEQKGAGLFQLLVAGGRLLGYKAGCVLGADSMAV